MTALLWLALLSTAVPTVQTGRAVETGIAKFYGKGTMEKVYQVRERQNLVPYGYIGDMGAAIECSDLGQIWWASYRNPQTGAWSPYRRTLIVDCSQYVDRARHYREGLILEAGYTTAHQTGWAPWGKTRVRVVGAKD